MNIGADRGLSLSSLTGPNGGIDVSPSAGPFAHSPSLFNGPAAGGGGGGGGGTPGVQPGTFVAGLSGARTEQYGYRFTPPSGITVVGLRVYVATATTMRARLWRDSDSAVLADETISTDIDTWSDSATISVALSPSTDYVVGVVDNAGGSYNRYSGGTLNYESAIGFDVYIFGTVGTNQKPTQTSGSPLGYADILFQ